MADLYTVKKTLTAKCSKPNWLCARKSEVNSIGMKQGTSRVIKMLKITSWIVTEESPKRLT